MLQKATALVVLLFCAHFTAAQNQPAFTQGVSIPNVIRFGGNVGELGPASTGVQKLTFTIYESFEDSDALWSETDNVLVGADGHYIAYIGLASGAEGVPTALFTSGKARWIGITTSEGIELQRGPIVSVPYAFEAASADTLGGHRAEEFVSVRQLSTLLPNMILAPPGPSAGIAEASQAVPRLHPGLPAWPPDSVYAKLKFPNVFEQQQEFAAGTKLSAALPDAIHRNFTDSAPLDFQSLFTQPETGQALSQLFRWSSQPLLSPAGTPSAQLGLLFGQGNSVPQPTGFSINSDGTINFAPGQTFPSSAISAAISNSQNGSSTGSSSQTTHGSPVVNTDGYQWSETPVGGAIAAGPNTLTLLPCPKGVNGSDVWHFLYISKTGTPEAVLITGGSCVSRAKSGTVEFSAKFNHPPGYSIGSATDGVQEAAIDAAPTGKGGQVARNVQIDPGSHVFHARLSIRATGITITSSGATITCEVQDTCIMLGDPANGNSFLNITVNGLRVIAGVPSGTWPALEDNANGSTISDLAPLNSLPGGGFGSLIQVDNDQAAKIDGVTTSSGYSWSHCDASFCSTAIIGPGGKNKAGVIWVQNSNLSLNCTANGIDDQDGNTLRVSNTIVQAYPQFGVRSRSSYSDVPSVQLDNVYEEIGNCVNPRGTGMAGVIAEGGYADVRASVGPAGQLPVFVSTGTTQYNYSIVVHSSTWGASPAYLAGSAYTNGAGGIPVTWNQVGNTGTVTYDVLRTSGSTNVAPYGTGSFAVAIGIPASSCLNSLCTFTDHAEVTPASYTVAANTPYWPALIMWPGSVILTTPYDYENTGGGTPTYYFTDNLSTGAGIVNSAGGFEPSVFATVCNSVTPLSSIWIQCVGGNAASNDNPAVAATILQSSGNGASSGGLKGRLIFEMPPNSSVGATEVVTLADSNPTKTMAAVNSRPSWDANDTYIGFDHPAGTNVSNTQLSFGAPVSISHYIGNTGDNVSWGERLTKSSKIFQVPVVAKNDVTVDGNLYLNGSCRGGGCGPFSPSGTQVTDTFNQVNGPLDPNWTITAGSWNIVSDQATFVGDGSSDDSALAAYTGGTFSSDQSATAQVIFGLDGTTAAGVGVRMASTSKTGYVCFAAKALTLLLKYSNGARSALGIAGPGLPTGDYLTAQVAGTAPATISCLDNGLPIPGVTAADSSAPLTSGYPGMFGEYALSSYLDNFSARSLAYSTNSLISFAGGQQVLAQPFSALSACAPSTEGTQQALIDSNTKSLGAIISSGGGPYHALAYCDGSNWIVATAAQ